MENLLLVKDLIKHLQKFDENLPVGFTGWYGEFFPLNIRDIYKHESYRWSEIINKFEILDFGIPQIGEEPN